MSELFEYKCNNCGHEGTNTRADPDVPELVRYDKIYDYEDGTDRMMRSKTGEYVRYDQAAAVIAAEHQKTKDAEELAFRMDRFAQTYLKHKNIHEKRADIAEAELATLKEINATLMGDDEDKPRYTKKRLKYEIEKAVTAKLAQYEAQEPVKQQFRFRYRNNEKQDWSGWTDWRDGVTPESSVITQYETRSLYAAPVDQTAEIERLEETLQEIANSYTAHGYNDAVDAVVNLQNIAKDCLNAKC